MLKKERLLALITLVFCLICCLSSGVIKKLLHETQKRKKKHNKLLYLGKHKLCSIEMMISQSIADLNITHDEFTAILNDKNDYDDHKNRANESKTSETEMV